MNVKHLDHLNLTVKNLEESVRWYGEVFGFVPVERGERQDEVKWAIVRSGEALLCLYERAEMASPPDWQDPKISVHRINHFGLRITDGAAWEKTVKECGLKLRYGGAGRFPHSTSWYLLDPTGHEIEVALWDGDRIRFEGDEAGEKEKFLLELDVLNR